MARFQPFNAAAAIQAGQGIARNNMALQAGQREMQKQTDVQAAGSDQKAILDTLMRYGDVEGAQRAAQVYDYMAGRDRSNTLAEQQMTMQALKLAADIAPLAARDPALYPAFVRELERGKLVRPGELPAEFDPERSPALLGQMAESAIQIISGGAANQQFGTSFPGDAALKVETNGGKPTNVTSLYSGTKPSTATPPETWQQLSAEESKGYGPGRFQRSTRGQVRQISGSVPDGGASASVSNSIRSGVATLFDADYDPVTGNFRGLKNRSKDAPRANAIAARAEELVTAEGLGVNQAVRRATEEVDPSLLGSPPAGANQVVDSAGGAPPMDQRVVGQTYRTPRGNAIWRGTGWQLVP